MTGAELRDLRLRCGVTQQQLAEAVGRNFRTVSDHERSTRLRRSTSARYRDALLRLALRSDVEEVLSALS